MALPRHLLAVACLLLAGLPLFTLALPQHPFAEDSLSQGSHSRQLQQIKHSLLSFCSGKEDGLHAHPEHCNKFLACSDGKTYEFDCAHCPALTHPEKCKGSQRLFFDANVQYCNWPSEVKGCEAEASTNAGPEPVPVPNKVADQEVDRFIERVLQSVTGGNYGGYGGYGGYGDAASRRRLQTVSYGGYGGYGGYGASTRRMMQAIGTYGGYGGYGGYGSSRRMMLGAFRHRFADVAAGVFQRRGQ